jgi:SAM-dependent methyltransferase
MSPSSRMSRRVVASRRGSRRRSMAAAPVPGVLVDITTPYTAIEAWTYDRFIAPAVAEFFKRNLGEILDRIPKRGQVLDVGCGGGQALALLAARRPDLRLFGVDLPGGLGAGGGARRAPPATIVEGSALKLPYATDCFDLVFSDASIKHWPEPARGLRECIRVLRPGGRLVVTEADRGCRLEDAAAFVRRWRLPRVMFPLNLALFRTWVAGQAFDLAEFEAFAAALPLEERRARQVEGTPGLVLEGIKRGKRRAARRRKARARAPRPNRASRDRGAGVVGQRSRSTRASTVAAS